MGLPGQLPLQRQNLLIPTPPYREDLGLPLNINQSFLPHVTMPPTLTEGQMMSP